MTTVSFTPVSHVLLTGVYFAINVAIVFMKKNFKLKPVFIRGGPFFAPEKCLKEVIPT